MFKKTLLLAGAASLAASSAFAAGFDINNGETALADISSGTVSVDDCTGGLLLDVIPGEYDHAEGDWAVESVQITSAAGDLAEDCAGFEVSALIETRLYDEDDAVAAAAALVDTITTTAMDQGVVHTVTGTSSVITLTPTDTVFVRDIVDVAVLVDEPNLTVADEV